jgi:hypothetical protein
MTLMPTPGIDQLRSSVNQQTLETGKQVWRSSSYTAANRIATRSRTCSNICSVMRLAVVLSHSHILVNRL